MMSVNEVETFLWSQTTWQNFLKAAGFYYILIVFPNVPYSENKCKKPHQIMSSYPYYHGNRQDDPDFLLCIIPWRSKWIRALPFLPVTIIINIFISSLITFYTSLANKIDGLWHVIFTDASKTVMIAMVMINYFWRCIFEGMLLLNTIL